MGDKWAVQETGFLNIHFMLCQCLLTELKLMFVSVMDS